MPTAPPDVIFHSGRITTLNKGQPVAQAVAVKDGKFTAVGTDAEVLALAGSGTRKIDLQQRSVLPGLIDNHTHVIRGGLNYNMELRWDGVRSLADALAMLKAQVANTPAPQWVRVVGGFTEHQFAEKRLPTLARSTRWRPIRRCSPAPVRPRPAQRAALRAVGYTKDTPEPPGGEIVRDAAGNPGLLLAKPNATILYATLAKGPKLPLDYQVNSTRHFMRELNRLGVTGVIDAGGGSRTIPTTTRSSRSWPTPTRSPCAWPTTCSRKSPSRRRTTFCTGRRASVQAGQRLLPPQRRGRDAGVFGRRLRGLPPAAPDMPPQMEGELEEVVRVLVQNRWPWRLHATYDETISRALDVFEKVHRDTPSTA
jgi:predicted amidohydrolase YtcJ